MKNILTAEQVANKTGFNIKTVEGVTKQEGFQHFKKTEFGIKAVFTIYRNCEWRTFEGDFTYYI